MPYQILICHHEGNCIIFDMKLVKDPGSINFDINPYKPCVFNKISGGDQLNLVWYLYDMKILH